MRKKQDKTTKCRKMVKLKYFIELKNNRYTV